ncbi:hypothetical protein [uncultured Winogradskyella sp.]|uniref:hypothetical protein n=1 Tax=uncultured Winogradskyella sp. TaxID=395353 RepID=UPI0026077319|nr:hypothetical protein [uncultured Winogradskyella sp.]
MEFTPEFIEQNGLSEEQVKGITTLATDHIATLKKDWDGKANQNAEGILNGVIKSTQEKFGLNIEREQGEKYADYIERITGSHFETKQQEIDRLKGEYETKMKDFKGGDALKGELDAAKEKLDQALQKYANYDEIADKAKNYEDLIPKYRTLKEEVSFNSVKPLFPETVNPYEADAKWNAFKNEIKEKYTIEFVDNKAIAIDKENEHRRVDLSDLLSKNDEIQGLLEGRQQKGTGAEPKKLHVVEGVPFKVPENATIKEVSTLIKEYLATINISVTSPDYGSKFAELNAKITQTKKSA